MPEKQVKTLTIMNNNFTHGNDKDRILINSRKTRRNQTIGLAFLIIGIILFLLGIAISLGKGSATATIVSFPVITAGIVIFHNSRQ
jgi:hypothetical protein